MTPAQQALRDYQEELGLAGVMPLHTTPEQEDKLQRLVLATWDEEAERVGA